VTVGILVAACDPPTERFFGADAHASVDADVSAPLDGGVDSVTDNTSSICGDGVLERDEQCDDHNTAAGDGCSARCEIELCGDGIINNTTVRSNEACDTGGASQTCNADCSLPACGDGIVNAAFTPPGSPGPEQCDPPTADGCSDRCRFESCGNSVLDPGEQCDDGTNLPGSGCAGCHLEICGNGILDLGEECDDGNASDTDFCVSSSSAPSSCKLARCGDGHVEVGVEQCDDGGLNGTPGQCSATCRIAVCGNGILDAGEECDDGNTNPSDDCTNMCTIAM